MRFVFALVLVLLCPVGARAQDELATEVAIGDHGRLPDLSIDAAGAVHLVYVRCSTPDGGRGCAVRYRRWTEAERWSAEETVPFSTDTTGELQNAPRIATDETGSAHVVWGPNFRSAPGLSYARRDPSGAWSTARAVTDRQSEWLDVEVSGDTVVVVANMLVARPAGTVSSTYRFTTSAVGVSAFVESEIVLSDGRVNFGNFCRMASAADRTTLDLSWYWAQGFIGYRYYRFDGSSWGPLEYVTDLPYPSAREHDSIIEPSGRRTVALSGWTSGPAAQPVAIYVVEPDGATTRISTADLIGTWAVPSISIDASGRRSVAWNDASHQLRIARSETGSSTWSAESVFPTSVSAEQVELVSGGGYDHLVWRDPETGQLHHNARPLPCDRCADAGPAGIDAATRDAGASLDAAATLDAAILDSQARDAAGSRPAVTTGCGCSAGSRDPAPSLVVVAVALAGGLRRARRYPRTSARR